MGGNATPDGKGGLSGNPLDIEAFHQGTAANWKKLAEQFNIPVMVEIE